jgi:hypothetical protein
MSVVFCQVEVSALGWSVVQRSPTKCDVSECNREASIMIRPRPTRGSCAMEKKSAFSDREWRKPRKSIHDRRSPGLYFKLRPPKYEVRLLRPWKKRSVRQIKLFLYLQSVRFYKVLYTSLSRALKKIRMRTSSANLHFSDFHSVSLKCKSKPRQIHTQYRQFANARMNKTELLLHKHRLLVTHCASLCLHQVYLESFRWLTNWINYDGQGRDQF